VRLHALIHGRLEIDERDGAVLRDNISMLDTVISFFDSWSDYPSAIGRRITYRVGYDLMKARRSALIVSAFVVGMPWGKPL